tara:strand:+ start:524 stop:823 length:300 start_codon:yes stop_codon:yes gene_type:complete
MIVEAILGAIYPRRYPAEISCRECHLLDFVIIIQDNVFDSFTREREVPKVWETVEKFDGFLHGFDIHIIHFIHLVSVSSLSPDFYPFQLGKGQSQDSLT